MTKVVHVETGWADKNFEYFIQKVIDGWEKKGYQFKDIKVSSMASHSLLIFKKGEG